MDIIINDFSLSGQFVSIDEFSDYIYLELKPLLEQLSNLNCSLFKDHETYRCRVTKDLTLNDVLRIHGDPQITRLKSILANLFFNEPFWRDSPKTDLKATYLIDDITVFPNCFTEALERNGMLLSFKNSQFQKRKLNITKNDIKVTLFNISSYKDCLDNFYEDNQIDIVYYFSNYNFSSYNTRLCVQFAKRESTYYALDAMVDSLILEDKVTIKNDLLKMIISIINGSPSKFSKSMKPEPYTEFKTKISDGREFRFFYLSLHSRIIILNGIIKKTQSTPTNAKKLARKLAKENRL